MFAKAMSTRKFPSNFRKYLLDKVTRIYQGAVAAALTGERFDVVLFKVYEPGDSLANHQDIDGANLSVACFTFFTDASQACELDFCKYNGATTYSYRPQLSFRPDKCSMWFMSGATNSQYSHTACGPTLCVV